MNFLVVKFIFDKNTGCNNWSQQYFNAILCFKYYELVQKQWQNKLYSKIFNVTAIFTYINWHSPVGKLLTYIYWFWVYLMKVYDHIIFSKYFFVIVTNDLLWTLSMYFMILTRSLLPINGLWFDKKSG